MSFETEVLRLPVQPTYWWKMDDASGAAVAVELEAANNGTPQDGAVTFGVADPPPGCDLTHVASFAGAYLSTPDSIATPSAAFTKGIWLKTTATGCRGIFSLDSNRTGPPSGGRDFYTWQGTDNNLYSGLWNGSYYTISTGPINDGNWHFVADTFDGSTLRLYVDFVLKASVAATVESYTGFWRVCGSGAQSGWPALNAGSDNPWSGEACHGLVWMGTALTAAQITQLGVDGYPNWIGEAGWLS